MSRARAARERMIRSRKNASKNNGDVARNREKTKENQSPQELADVEIIEENESKWRPMSLAEGILERLGGAPESDLPPIASLFIGPPPGPDVVRRVMRAVLRPPRKPAGRKPHSSTVLGQTLKDYLQARKLWPGKKRREMARLMRRHSKAKFGGRYDHLGTDGAVDKRITRALRGK